MAASVPRRYGGPLVAVRRLVRTLVALVTLLALLVAVPLVLLRWGSWPITGVPTWEQVQELPTTLADDGAVLAVVTVALWAAWAGFAASVALEVATQVGGRASRVRLGPLGSAARYLVGSLVLSVGPLTGPAAALASPAPAVVPEATAAVPAAVPAVSSLDGSTPHAHPAVGEVIVDTGRAAPASTEADHADPLVVTVERGDTAWSLAATHLGDGARWRDIWEANRDRPQPGGGMWASQDQPVQAGWTLAVPGSPAASAPVQALRGPAAIAARVTVQPGDNFWDLAEGQLAEAWGRSPGDGEVIGHWQALVETNRGTLVPPGDPDLILPGQVFSVPATPAPPQVQGLAGGAEVEAPGPGPTAPTPSERPDCTPDEDPSGTAPADQAEDPSDTAPAEADGDPSGTAPADQAEGPSDTASAGAAVDPAEGAPPPTTVPGSPPTGASPPTSGVEGTRTTPMDDEGDGAGASAPVGLAGGGIAVAGALVLLDRRRRAQQRHRRPGRVIPMPAPAGRAVEAQLRWGADIAGARLLDVALRAAAAGAGATGLPRLAWAEVQPDAALLVLTQPSPAPPGFAAVDGSRWITSAPLPELGGAAAHAAAPAPTLVPVGATDQGTELLVELEGSGVVTVDGPRGDVAGLLRALVVGLSTALWSDQPRIVTLGLEPELERLPGVVAAGSLGDALRLAEHHADAVTAALRSLRCPTLAQARAVGATPEAWDPLVILSAVPAGDRVDRRRLEDLARRPDTAVGLVVVPSVDTGVPGRRLTIGEHGWLTIDGVAEAARPRQLAGPDVAALVDLLAGAEVRGDLQPVRSAAETAPRRPPPPPPPPPVVGSGDSEPMVPAATPSERVRRDRLSELLSGVEVMVRVLGEVGAVQVTGPEGQGEPLIPKRQRALEAIAYLALRETTVDREDLEISLFPHGANAAKTLYNTVSSARALLGDELFPPPEGGRYELSPAVVTDYGVFSELTAEADETEDAMTAADLLHQALSLVRGEPFTGVGRSYAWVGPHRGTIVAQVVDAAEELAEVRLAAGDWRSAEWAARQGLRAFPSDERMYRLLMRTAAAAGNVPGVQRVFRELCDVLADPDLGVEPEDTVHPETIELLETLTGSAPRERRLGA
jgi:DNA-binding SARP family transcriptional activator/nucleoid-associated protein YgaU